MICGEDAGLDDRRTEGVSRSNNDGGSSGEPGCCSNTFGRFGNDGVVSAISRTLVDLRTTDFL